jgi:hypothetical protein
MPVAQAVNKAAIPTTANIFITLSCSNTSNAKPTIKPVTMPDKNFYKSVVYRFYFSYIFYKFEFPCLSC